MTPEPEPQHFGAVVIGAGFGGLAAAHALKHAGEDFVVLEREQEVGGVWRDNTYPGCACDIPSHLYSLSFAPNPHWTQAFSPQAEIRDYLCGVARDHGLLAHIRFGTSLLQAAWDDAAQRWLIQTNAGPLSADVLVDATGPIADPSTPDLPGLSGFAGEVFHSARWRHDIDLTGRNVVVVGTGASAIQFVPAIQPQVRRMTVVQRSAPWITPRMNRTTTRLERRLYAAAPWLQRLVRHKQYQLREQVLWKIMVSPRVRRAGHRDRQIPPAPPGGRPGAAATADAYLAVGLQTHPDLQRLVPGGVGAQRRGGQRRRRRGPGEHGGHHGRPRAPRRRDHLRHRLPRRRPANRRTPARPRRPDPGRVLERPARTPTSASP